MLHVNKYSLWFSISTAVILLGPNASGEGEEQVAAFGGEAGPPQAGERRACQGFLGPPALGPGTKCQTGTEAFVSLEALAELPPPCLTVREVSYGQGERHVPRCTVCQ